MTFSLHPLAFIAVSAGPGIYSAGLETVLPGSWVLSLTLGASAHTVTMGLSVFPAPTVCTPIIEIKPTASAHPAAPAAGTTTTATAPVPDETETLRSSLQLLLIEKFKVESEEGCRLTWLTGDGVQGRGWRQRTCSTRKEGWFAASSQFRNAAAASAPVRGCTAASLTPAQYVDLLPNWLWLFPGSIRVISLLNMPFPGRVESCKISSAVRTEAIRHEKKCVSGLKSPLVQWCWWWCAMCSMPWSIRYTCFLTRAARDQCWSIEGLNEMKAGSQW